MVLFTLFFVFGDWLLQQLAALPPLSTAWFPLPVLAALAMPVRMARPIRALLIAILAALLGFYHAAWQSEQRLAVSLPDSWQKRDIAVTGVVAELPHLTQRGQRFMFDVEKTLTPGVEVPKRIYLATYADTKYPPPGLHAGERWRLTLRLKQPHGSSNPHGFDFEFWALENNVRATGYVNNRGDNLRLQARAEGMRYRIETWREAVRDKFDASLGHAPYAGVLTALAIGDQDSISQAQWQLFRRTGVIHLMSISGLHITLLSGMGFALVYWLWRRSVRLTLRLPARRAAAIAALLIACGYALLAGYGVPAQRTVYMVAAAACALWLDRNFSLGQILSIALLGVLIPDPWAVLSPGFWLSFGAVMLILYTTAHRIGEADDAVSLRIRLVRTLKEYATVQWAVTIGLIPPLLALFGQLSLVSPLANAFAIPLVSLIVVPLTLLGAALPTEVPLWLAHIAMDGVMSLLKFLNELPQAVWVQHAPPPWSIVTGMLGAIWLLAPKGFPARWLGALAMLPMFLNGPEPPPYGMLRLTVFDVGQGLSVLAQTRNHALLYDTGPDYSGESDNRILIPALQGSGIEVLDGLILSHNDLDHIGGTASVLQAIPAGWLSASQPDAYLKRATTWPGDIRRCRDGDRWEWDGVRFEILHPGRNSGNPTRLHDNEQSCVLRIGIGDRHVLLAGDIEKHAEQRLLEKHAEQLSANLLVVPHHGSGSSSDVDFIAAVLPDYAVFTVGYLNRFGHPRKTIRQRYLDSGATLLRTDLDGAILVSMQAHDLGVERYRSSHHRYWTHQPPADL